jgi:hypothetical protein
MYSWGVLNQGLDHTRLSLANQFAGPEFQDEIGVAAAAASTPQDTTFVLPVTKAGRLRLLMVSEQLSI